MQKGDSNRNSGNGDGTPVRLADFADKCGTVVKVDPVDCERNSPIPSVPSNKSYTVTTVPITVNTSMFSAHPPHNYAKTEGSPPDCSEWSKKEFQQQVATWKEGNADQHQRIPLGLPPNVLARSGNLKRAFVPSFGNPPRKRPRQVKTNELNVNCVNSASPSPLSGVRPGGSTSAILIAASTPGGGSWQKPPRKVAADCGAVQGDLVSPGAAIFLDPSGKFLTLNTQNSSSNGATALVLPNKVQNGILLAKSSASFAKSGNVINSGQQSVVLGCVGAGSIGKTVVQSEGSSNCTLVPTGPAALVRVPISSGKLQNQHIGNPGLVQQAGTISLTSRNSAQSLSYHQFPAGLAQQVHIGRQQPQPLL